MCIILVNERCRSKEEASKVKQTTIKAKQHSTPKAVIFKRKSELPRVGFEVMTLHTLDRTLYQLNYCTPDKFISKSSTR